ncbi:MAG: glycosyltransferase family 2 protein [Planctomycetia bacterium]|nr:glycosyltransferase family 2 protein [Planctomycetia bacterium]
MLEIFEYLLLANVLLTAIPIVVLFVECCAALRPLGKRTATARRPSVDVLIPAHNEEDVLEATLRSVAAQILPGDRILVVADNCSDSTAAIARRAGAEVAERHDTVRRGKGYALDHGLRVSKQNAREVVVIVDADCTLGPGALDLLARTADERRGPVQAHYRMTCLARPTPRDIVSRFAVMMKNLVRQQGVTSLGGSCILTGSGMAFPRAVLEHVELSSGNLVEDMQLSFDLLLAGYVPTFCVEAEVVAPLPNQHGASIAQRTRWEHGHLQTLLHRAPRLFWAGLRQRRAVLLGAAMDLAVPPLSLLVVAWCGALGASLLGIACGTNAVAALVALGSGCLLLASVLIAHFRFNGETTLAALLTAVPYYVCGKLPIYFSFLLRRQTVWVRTDRATGPLHLHTSTQHRAEQA